MSSMWIEHRGEREAATMETWEAVSEALIARLGPWVPGQSRVVTAELSVRPEPIVSSGSSVVLAHVTSGEVDPGQRDRIEGLHQQLQAGGIQVAASEQLYPTGTRMLEVGYDTQTKRAEAHAKLQPLRDAAESFVSRIRDEQRRDVVMRAGDVAQHLTVNGALKLDGYKLQELAVRGLLARIGSPALSFVLGVRDRLVSDRDGNPPTEEQKRHDRETMLDTLQRELRRFPDVELRLRRRDALGDIFAVVSPSYGEADAPSVVPDVLRALDGDVKGSVQYDPTSTRWEVRASVFTPTAVDEQHVGEPFSGYASFRSTDNGTGGLEGGGGIELLRCLNASVYIAEANGARRIHRVRILVDLRRMTIEATKAIRVLCAAWGTARADVLDMPAPALVKLEDVVPGFFRHMLTARRGELVGVLPGRSESHVKGLSLAYDAERRNPKELVRADLAQGFTRYVQQQPVPVRRDAEAAIGRWLVNRDPVACLPA